MNQQFLSSVLTGVILLGLLMFSLGLSLWVLGLLAQYGIAWEIELAVTGILLLLFGILAARLLSRD